MTLIEWNNTQVYFFRKYKIDPHNIKLIVNLASCIGTFREVPFSLEVVDEMDIIINKLIKFLEEK